MEHELRRGHMARQETEIVTGLGIAQPFISGLLGKLHSKGLLSSTRLYHLPGVPHGDQSFHTGAFGV